MYISEWINGWAGKEKMGIRKNAKVFLRQREKGKKGTRGSNKNYSIRLGKMSNTLKEEVHRVWASEKSQEVVCKDVPRLVHRITCTNAASEGNVPPRPPRTLSFTMEPPSSVGDTRDEVILDMDSVWYVSARLLVQSDQCNLLEADTWPTLDMKAIVGIIYDKHCVEKKDRIRIIVFDQEAGQIAFDCKAASITPCVDSSRYFSLYQNEGEICGLAFYSREAKNEFFSMLKQRFIELRDGVEMEEVEEKEDYPRDLVRGKLIDALENFFLFLGKYLETEAVYQNLAAYIESKRCDWDSVDEVWITRDIVGNCLGWDSMAARVARLIHQNVLFVGVFQLKTLVTSQLNHGDDPSPDGWLVDVEVLDEVVQVTHTKKEKAMRTAKADEFFVFTWKISIALDRDTGEIVAASQEVIDLQFNDQTKPEFKAHLTSLLHGGHLKL